MKKSLLLLTFALIANLFLNFSVNAQLDLPEDKVNWEFSVQQDGCEAIIIGKITTVPHWHVNAVYLPEESFSIPTLMEIKSSNSFKKKGKLTEPKPIIIFDEDIDEELRFHEGTFYLKQKITVTSEKDFVVEGNFSFQTCTDAGLCLPPFDVDFTVDVKGCKEDLGSDVIEADPEETPEDLSTDSEADTEVENTESEELNTDEHLSEKDESDSKGGEKKETRSLWTIFFLAFASGFAALLTPCVFPMIPMTVSFFTKQSKSKAQGIKNAIIFGVSIILIYIILGTVVTAVFGSDALNAMSTNFWFNLIFFILLVVFAVSFMGAFEIRLPNSWLNKADQASDKGGMIGIFFMALALALVSFSCTGPIVGTLLVESATIGGMGPFVGMFGFSFALALPFTLFAAFPGWMNTLPKSGGWLNTVKVFLGFLELALAFKFLSNADLVIQAHFLEREMFLAIWIGVFAVLAMYLFGMFSLPHDSPLEQLSVGRAMLGTSVVIFIIYLIPGLWGAPLKVISGFPPPMSYSESPMGFGGGGGTSVSHGDEANGDMHLGEHGIMLFHDYDKGVAYAKEVGKPVLLDFTGYACVNCRRMEATVWGEPEVLGTLKNDVVMISLYVDDKTELPKEEQVTVNITDDITRDLVTYGNKWSHLQATRYETNSQPYYRMLGPNEEDLTNGSADYQDHREPAVFKKWLDEGLKLYKDAK